METQKVYKALWVDGGVLKSVYAGHYTGTHYKEDLKGVTYVEGHISYAPEGQQGLAVWTNIGAAIDFCEYNNVGKMVVHEATALGKEGCDLLHDKNGATYPAILLGKEVWSDKPTEQTRLEDIQKDLGGDITKCARLGLRLPPYSIYWNRDRYTVYKGSNGVVYEGKSTVDTVRFIKRDIERDRKLKEEWVDVTKECELRFLDNYPYDRGGTTIEITHCGSFVARLGIGQPSHVGGGGRYKVEEVTHDYIGQMSTFKVLKKVV